MSVDDFGRATPRPPRRHEAGPKPCPFYGQAAPPGWKLVPREPTEYMIHAGENEILSLAEDIEAAQVRCAYRAMLAAAPQWRYQGAKMNESQIRQAHRARATQAIRAADEVAMLLGQQRDESSSGDRMQEIRDIAESLLQCVHEMSAYHNALTTGGKP